MTTADAQLELSTLLSDTLQQVSADRLTQAITQAWRDGYVVTKVYDSSVTFVQGTYEYAVPATVSNIESIETQRDSSQPPEPIDASFWSVVSVGGVRTLKISTRGNWVLPSGYPLFIRGKYKLTTSDPIPTNALVLQNYVVSLAAFIVLKQIGYTKVLSFLQNDTSMSELLAFRNQMQQDMFQYRAQLSTEYVDA